MEGAPPIKQRCACMFADSSQIPPKIVPKGVTELTNFIKMAPSNDPKATGVPDAQHDAHQGSPWSSARRLFRDFGAAEVPPGALLFQTGRRGRPKTRPNRFKNR